MSVWIYRLVLNVKKKFIIFKCFFFVPRAQIKSQISTTHNMQTYNNIMFDID